MNLKLSNKNIQNKTQKEKKLQNKQIGRIDELWNDFKCI
jgi:hypothetical protein